MSDAKRIVQAIATLVRASYIDELPSDGERNQWRAVGHAARHDVDSLRAAQLAAESRAQRAEAALEKVRHEIGLLESFRLELIEGEGTTPEPLNTVANYLASFNTHLRRALAAFGDDTC
ncbi:hypothetical protein LCGC14_2214470 [marine sediment metagenome]|uniref:Uncharacterized protein n=1 Tax=marine sediment metagenome TaxID=412755 RepID=A0A0F9DCZ7_9ZZZZ